jgi:hypothetical protein
MKTLSYNRPGSVYENEDDEFGHGYTNFNDPLTFSNFYNEFLETIVKETDIYAFQKPIKAEKLEFSFTQKKTYV